MTLLKKDLKKNALYKVLLVEEDPKEFEFYSELIREVANCEIDVITGAKDFLEWIDRFNYHLIVIVQEDTGLMLLEQIKRTMPSTSVIIVSARATVEQAVSAIRMGAEDYLTKPFKMEAFQLAVKRGLDRKVVFGDQFDDASAYIHLLNCSQLISGTLEQEKIFGIIQSYLLRELGARYSAVYRVDENKPIRVSSIYHVDHPDRTLEEVLDITLHANNSLSHFSDSNEFYRFIEKAQLTPALFVFCFRCVGQVDYFCVCLSPVHPTSRESFESRLRLLKMQIEVTGKNIEQYLGVQQLVYVDDVTGLYNTRYLHTILDREIIQSETSGESFAVLFIDVDKFKSLNDTFGHPVGTKLLNELGSHLSKYVRESDTVFRYGGDEFVAVLSPCDLDTAKTVAEQIRSSIASTYFLEDDGLKIQLTISIGVALFPDHAKAKKDIIEAADQAMYDAKRVSRNRVFIAPIGLTVQSQAAQVQTAPKGKRQA